MPQTIITINQTVVNLYFIANINAINNPVNAIKAMINT